MIGKVYSILEKEPPVNKALLVASHFDPHSLFVRYCIAEYNGQFFRSEKSEVLNVGFWCELQNIEVIENIEYQKFSNDKYKKSAKYWLKKFNGWKFNFYRSLWGTNDAETIFGDDELIEKFLESLDTF